MSLCKQRTNRQREARARLLDYVTYLEHTLRELGTNIDDIKYNYRLSACSDAPLDYKELDGTNELNGKDSGEASGYGLHFTTSEVPITSASALSSGLEHFYIGDENDYAEIVADDAEIKEADAAGAVEKAEVEVVETSYEGKPVAVTEAERWKEIERIEAMFGYPPRRGRKWKRRKKLLNTQYSMENLD